MHELQHLLDTHTVNYKNPDEVAQLGQIPTVYAQLQTSAAVEHFMEALIQEGASHNREPLTRELVKILSIQDRALARAQREKDSKVKEQRRIEREAKRELAQTAKQTREDRLFNQREAHLTRKEKLAQTKLDKRANLLRVQPAQHASYHTSPAPNTQHSVLASQCATDIPVGAYSPSNEAPHLKSDTVSS